MSESDKVNTSSNEDENSWLISSNISASTLPKLSLATSDLRDYNENTSLLSDKDDIEMLQRMQSCLSKDIDPNIRITGISIKDSDIIQYAKENKPQQIHEHSINDNSDDIDDKIMNGNSETGLYKEKTITTTYTDTLEQDIAKYKKNIKNKTHPKHDVLGEVGVVTNQCCHSICNPQITLIKDQQGRHDGIIRCYGKSFSYKQIIGFGIFFISFVFVVSAIAVNIWVFCEGTTASEHSISLIWSHDRLSISVGNKASSSMLYKHIVEEVSNLDHSEISQPLPTVFDEDYDYTKWPLIQQALHSQSDKRDLISLLEWSQNNRIKHIEYQLNLMYIFNIICVCCLGILMFLMIMFVDRYYLFQYILTFISFLFIILAIIYWGIANQHIEQYNHLLWCHTGNSFIVLSTGMANLFLILFIFTLPKRQDLYKYDLNKHYQSIMAQLTDIPSSIQSQQLFSTQQSSTSYGTDSVGNVDEIEMQTQSEDEDESSLVSLGDTFKNTKESETNTNSIDEETSLVKSNIKDNTILFEERSEEEANLGFGASSNVVSENDIKMKRLEDSRESTETSEL